ncbi:MAG: nicotinate-nucleotide adenylyltransferase [Methylobacter sp.]
MIGIFGGTFDPVHYGHLRSAFEVKEIFDLDEVRLIPCASPAHRDQPEVLPAMRLRMLELAINGHPGFKIDSRELDRYSQSEHKPSYMVDTLESLRQEFPTEPLLLFIGSDAFKNLNLWHQWQRLFDYAHIVVLTRPGFEIHQLDDFFKAKLTHNDKELARIPSGKLYFQSVTQLDISATAIRNLIATNRNPVFLLPDAVIEYIKQHKLYETC